MTAQRSRALPVILGAVAVLIALAVGFALLSRSEADAPVAAPTEATPSPEPTALPSSPTPSPTPSPNPSPSPSPAPSPTVTATPTATAEPTATPSPTTLAALEGSAQLEDQAGDLVDSVGGQGPDPDPAADLREVRLDGAGDTLTVTFEMDGAIPSSADYLLWSLELFDGEDRLYSITVQQAGTQFFAGVLDWSTSAQRTPPEEPVIEDNTVSLTVPAALLTRLDGPFEWQALSQQDGSFEDYTPAEDERVPFPG